MFEKEAEEYIRNKFCTDCVRVCSNGEYCCEAEEVKKLLSICIEFGYNKANEWHKQEVDDIYDLISEDWSIRYFICIMKDKRRVTAIGNCDEGCNGEVGVNIVFDHDDSKYYLDDIVW